MTDFKLPDLGEGLPDAEIVKWHVAVGDDVVEGDMMVEMSTAKAVVEVPSPYTGKVVKLFGGMGDVIDTGSTLISFAVGDEVVEIADAPKAVDVTEEAVVDAAPVIEGEAEVFRLPDLGEGLPDAEIVKWHVAVGDAVAEGDLMVEMSTAKAVVEVPSPFTGTVTVLHGGAGDVIDTGAALIEMATGNAPAPQKAAPKKADAATVVGSVVVGTEIRSEATVSKDGIKAGPAVRAMAKKAGVDLASLKGSGAGGEITLSDVKNAPKAGEAPKAAAPQVVGEYKISPSAKALAASLALDISTLQPADGKTLSKADVLAAVRSAMQGGAPAPQTSNAPVAMTSGKNVQAAPKVRAYARDKGVDLAKVSATGPMGNVTLDDVNKALKSDFAVSAAPTGTYQRPARAYDVTGEPQKFVGPRRYMAQAMAKANMEVCHTSIFDEADISGWLPGADITVRIMRSIIAGAMVEPAMNAHYDHETLSKTIQPHVNLGIAVDSERGLFVPVIKNADAKDGAALRADLNSLRGGIKDGTIKAADMSGATITLSNFGMIAGRFATPIITQPEVAIVGIGGLFEKLVMTDKGIGNHRHIPVSLTFDHRAATGGEAARFLGALKADLELPF